LVIFQVPDAADRIESHAVHASTGPSVPTRVAAMTAGSTVTTEIGIENIPVFPDFLVDVFQK
jgi:hypothetical protein